MNQDQSSIDTALFGGVARDLCICHSAEEALEAIRRIYDESREKIRQALDAFEKEDNPESLIKSAVYPYLGIAVPSSSLNIDARVAYGAVLEAGVYGTTLTRPELFESYYREQIHLLIQHHNCPVVVGKSTWPIPIPFADEDLWSRMTPEAIWENQGGFALPDLTKVDDSIANGTYVSSKNCLHPLALFTAERVDYSLHRLHHYCGTGAEHFQSFILLTNYQRYIDAFVEFGLEQLAEDTGYTAFVAPGDQVITAEQVKQGVSPDFDKGESLPQMPAYHLKRSDGKGITFINIGVGPTNAKNITDHLAVLRPHCWIMLGHCAGFRRSQRLGDYVLAHGYVRKDGVLDDDLPPWIPVPPIAEIQVALQEAVVKVTGLEGLDLKKRIRTGTVVSADDRNWELRSSDLFRQYNKSRAIALDLESATVATNGFRFRVPYGTLLCVSDKPLHGELKLRGMASQFYRDRVRQHLEIGLETVKILRSQDSEVLHSRKLRGFDEPPFR